MQSKQAGQSKIGFWTLISIVISAQLGASIFLMPFALAPFRTIGLLGWAVAGLGAVLITVVFSYLCTQTSKAAGPHIYAEMFFGKKVGFFVTWVYWCGAWACNPIMIATAINYLMSCIGDLPMNQKLFFEISLVISLTLINTRGVKTSGYFEVLMTILKMIPLVLIPIVAFSKINFDNFSEIVPNGMTAFEAISKATILSFWGFVGLEGGTSPAGAVENPKRTIPLAIVLGTAFVAITCIVTTVAIFGIIPPEELETVEAPFAYIMVKLFGGGSYDKIIGIVTFLMCAGSLNAWVLFSGQIAQSAAKSKIFPSVLGNTNKKGAPGTALWISAIGTILLLCLQKTEFIGDKIVTFLDMSVIVYVCLYAIAVLANIKNMIQQRNKNRGQIIISGLALFFCLFLLLKSDLASFAVLVGMLIIGAPIFFKMKNKREISAS